jgi:hypothetical protein
VTRVHAARQLLALGPLPLCEFIEITGWPRKVARKVLAGQVERGVFGYAGTTWRGLYFVRTT